MKTLFMVRSNPVAGAEAAFNDWYDNTHLPEVLQIEGFIRAQRFVASDTQVQEQQREFLAIYEIDATDIEGTLASLNATTLNMTDAIDLASIEISIFSALAEPQIAG